MFIFDRCPHSLAVVAPVKYERDSTDLADAFYKSKNLWNDDIRNESLVTPTSDWMIYVRAALEWTNSTLGSVIY